MYPRCFLRSGARPRRSISTALLSASVALPLITTSSNAQTVEQLPEIVVEGATLETPKSVKMARPTKSSNTAPGSTATGNALAAEPGPAEGNSQAPGVPIEQIGAAVTIVTRKDLKERQIRYVADALRSMPGVEVSSPSGPGGLTQVRIRGAEANHTLVLIDGIEANNPTDGEFDFSNLDANDVERIEVIRGPMSGLYGSSAVGGVINILTRGGRGPLTFSGRVEGGSLATSDFAGSVSAGNDKGHIALSYHRRQSEGFDIAPGGNETDSWQLSTFSLRAGLNVLDTLSVNIALRNMNKAADRDGFGGTPGFLATAIDDPSSLTSDTWLAGVNVRWDTLDGKLTHEVRATRNAAVTTDTDLSFTAFPFYTRNESEDIKYGYLATWRFATPGLAAASHSVSALIEREIESFTPAGDFADALERTRDRESIIGEYRGDYANTVFVTANIRHDDNEGFDDFTTWRSAVSVPLKGVGLRPHASVGTAVKFPNMFELFGSIPGFFTPNPDLQPEESFGWDAGVEYTFGAGIAVLDVTYFRTNLKNEIVTLGFPYSLENADGESSREGIEVAARAKLFAGLTLGGAYTYLEAKNDSGEEAIRRPPHTARFDLNYVFDAGRANLNLAAIYNGRQTDLGFRMPTFSQERVLLDSYWMTTIAASYQLTPGVELFGRVENVLDDDYQETYGFETAGTTAFAGLRFTYVEAASIPWAEGR